MDPRLTTKQLRELVQERTEKADAAETAFSKFRQEFVAEHGAEKIARDKGLFAQLEARKRKAEEARTAVDEAKDTLLMALETEATVRGRGAKALDVTSGGTLPFHDQAEGIRALPQRDLFLRDLVATATMDSEEVHYVRESAFTNAAAPTAPGALKPTTVENLERVVARASPIAHVSEGIDRFLVEDNDQIDPHMRQRMVLGVLLAEEAQCLGGNGTYPNLRGILNTVGIQTQALGGDDRATAIFKALVLIQLQFADADAIVIHPNDWRDVRLMKDANGNFITAPMVDEAPDRIWGVRVLQSPAITEGTALVGAFKAGAQLWIRNQPEIAIAETGLGNAAGEEMFSRNQVRYRAEERVAFGVIRPAFFCTVTGI